MRQFSVQKVQGRVRVRVRVARRSIIARRTAACYADTGPTSSLVSLRVAVVYYGLVVSLYSATTISNTKQDSQALIKAKYCPRVAAASGTQKNTPNPTDR